MFDFLLHNGLTLLGFGGYALVGIFAVLGYFNGTVSSRRKESDSLADGLISRLKETVDQQQKTMDATNVRLDQTTKELHQMQGRNGMLEELFKGRDPAMQTFLQAAPRLIEIANENNVLAKATSTSVAAMADALTGFMIKLAESPSPVPQFVLKDK